MKLYGYFRSSCSYRVRIALHYKKLDFEYIPVNLKEGEQLHESYLKLQAQGFVPLLVDGQDSVTQSMSIIEYLDEKYEQNPLIFGSPLQRSRIRTLAQILACDTQPVQNLRVLKYLKSEMGLSDDKKNQWAHDFIQSGLSSFEKTLETTAAESEFCVGSSLSMADVCLIPQLFNARRFHVNLADFKNILRIEKNLMELDCVKKSIPEVQVDCPTELRS